MRTIKVMQKSARLHEFDEYDPKTRTLTRYDGLVDEIYLIDISQMCLDLPNYNIKVVIKGYEPREEKYRNLLQDCMVMRENLTVEIEGEE
jgi:hypothetical protein